MNLRFFVLLAFSIACAKFSFGQSGPVTVASPDGRLVATFETVVHDVAANSGSLAYSVRFGGKPLVERSALSLELEGQRPLGTDVHIVNSTP
jgi:alpha-glucosidase